MAAQLTIRRRKRTMPILSSQLLMLTVAIIIVLGFGLTTTMAANSPPPSPKRPPPPVKSPTPPPPVKLSPPPKPPPPVKLSPPPKPPPPVKLSPPPKPPPPVKLSPPPKLSSPPKSPPPSRYPSPPPPLSLSSFNDTLRLVRGSELWGRLEVKVGPVPYNEWVTLCDDGSFTTYEAMQICQKCGFLYGRPYYASGINSFGADEVDRPDTYGKIVCPGDGESMPRDFYPITRLLLFNDYDYSKQCFVFPSTCPNQVLVGLECSNNPFPTAPPPPPVPPRPPPPPFPPPSMQNDIKLIVVESNQVPFISRVELRVNSSSDGHTGPSVWAPLCAPSNDDVYDGYERPFGMTMCKQADGFEKSPLRFVVGAYLIKYALPTGPSSALGGFDPAQYTRWVTVVGKFDAYTVHDMTLQVSNERCASGFILGLQCIEAMA